MSPGPKVTPSVSQLPLALFALSALVACDDVARVVDGVLAEPAPGYSDVTRDLTDALPVFPGAEGFGTDTPAGRGGTVVVVSNLNADGPGSLRSALAAGNRTILFEVGGTIRVTEDIPILFPFVTVAGESAPAPGITVVGAGFVIKTHDVLLSHLKVRPGDFEDGPRPDVRDAISIVRDESIPEAGRVGHIVVDHCSLSWSIDETASTTYPLVSDVTFSNTIIAEGLRNSLHSEGEHSKGLIVGSGSRRIAVVNNLFAHNNDRNPLIGYDSTVIVSGNVIYNPGEFGIVHYGLPGCCPASATVVNNRVIPGPDTPEDRGYPLHITSDASVDTRIFVEGNCGGDNRFDAVTPIAAAEVTVRPLSSPQCSDLPTALLDRVGAFPWDRDADDTRVVTDVREGTGGHVDTPPGMDALLAAPETRHVLDLPVNPNGDADGDGYTNLEAWLHQLRAR